MRTYMHMHMHISREAVTPHDDSRGPELVVNLCSFYYYYHYFYYITTTTTSAATATPSLTGQPSSFWNWCCNDE